MMSMRVMSLLKFIKVNTMTKFRVTIASTIYYQADIEADNEDDICMQFRNGEFDFTEWREADLDSHVYDIMEIK